MIIKGCRRWDFNWAPLCEPETEEWNGHKERERERRGSWWGRRKIDSQCKWWKRHSLPFRVSSGNLPFPNHSHVSLSILPSSSFPLSNSTSTELRIQNSGSASEATFPKYQFSILLFSRTGRRELLEHYLQVEIHFDSESGSFLDSRTSTLPSTQMDEYLRSKEGEKSVWRRFWRKRRHLSVNKITETLLSSRIFLFSTFSMFKVSMFLPFLWKVSSFSPLFVPRYNLWLVEMHFHERFKNISYLGYPLRFFSSEPRIYKQLSRI